MSEDGLSSGRMVEDNKSREKEKTVDQKKKGDRRQSMQQKKGKRVSVRQERSFADVVSQGRRGKPGYLCGIPSLGKWIKL